MKINIQASIYTTAGAAVGQISGTLELQAVPPIGTAISFLFTNNDVASIVVPHFSGILRVIDVTFVPNALRASISLNLEDLVLESVDDARIVMKYLEQGFGLFGDEQEPNP